MAKRINCKDVKALLNPEIMEQKLRAEIVLPAMLVDGKVIGSDAYETFRCPYCLKEWENVIPEGQRYWRSSVLPCPHCGKTAYDHFVIKENKERTGNYVYSTPNGFFSANNILYLKSAEIGGEKGIVLGMYKVDVDFTLYDKVEVKKINLEYVRSAFVTHEQKYIFDEDDKRCNKKLYTAFQKSGTCLLADEDTKNIIMNFPCMIAEREFSLDRWLTNFETDRDVTLQRGYVPLGVRKAQATMEKYPSNEIPPISQQYDKIMTREIVEDIIKGTHKRSNFCMQCGNVFEDEVTYKHGKRCCPHCGYEDQSHCGSSSLDRHVCFVSQSSDNQIHIRYVEFTYDFDKDWNHKLRTVEKYRCVIIVNENKPPEIHFLVNEGFGEDSWVEKGNYASSKFYCSIREICFDKEIPLLKYSGLYKFIDDCLKVSSYYSLSLEALISYIRYEREYPVLENLCKRNLSEIVKEEIGRKVSYGNFAFIDGSKIKVTEALKISEHFIKMLLERGVNFHNLDLLQNLYELDPDMRKEDFNWLCDYNVEASTISRIFRETPMTIKRLCEYLEHVRINQCFEPKAAICDWYDYLCAAKSIEVDLSDNKAKYPSSLKREHDRALAKQKLILDANKEKFFQEQTERYGAELSMETEKFMIIPPKDMKDLFEEGRKLCHCVGSYSDRIIQGTTCIMFIRRTEEPDKPYFTIEVEPRNNYVVQLRGLSNRSINRVTEKDLVQFLGDWGAKKHINVNRAI